MKKHYIFSILLLSIISGSIKTLGQNINWNSEPQTGYVFEISNDEAEQLLTKKNHDSLYYQLQHTLIDSFDITRGWINRPSQGHFIVCKINRNKLNCTYTPVFPYQVFLFKEYNALSLQVIDTAGNVRADAMVKLKLRKIPFDKESNTYRIENQWYSGDERLASVELMGFRSFFQITRHEVPTWNNNYGSPSGPDFYSYMITDKNKYKPGETLKFKSYVLSQYKSPLRKALIVKIRQARKTIVIGEIKPHRPGSYTSEIHLHDSLKLQLDREYTLMLDEKSGRRVASCRFKYEDYELHGNKLKIELDQKHYAPKNNVLKILATDVNGLILKDARANILVKTVNIQKTYEPLVILKDTLMYAELDLSTSSPTRFEIPSEIFFNSNTSYQVIVTVLNSQNQRMVQSMNASHYFSQYHLSSHLSNDSICFNFYENGEIKSGVKAELFYNNKDFVKTITLPYREKINPALASYQIKTSQISQNFVLQYMNTHLKILGGIEQDSFKIKLENPHLLNISYFIYQGAALLHKGFGSELDYSAFIEDRTKTFYVELLYSFGGQDHRKRQQFVFREDHLDVDLQIPDRVYPGQEVDARITVTNSLGEPVRGVDLTALAVSGKLNYVLPDLPYYGPTSSPRSMADHYSKQDRGYGHASLQLDYQRWRKIAHLDTMKYYQFTYPDTCQFHHYSYIADSTQFAPYVMQNGMARKIYVIEVDRNPVYYSWTDRPAEYSFNIRSRKYHEISLRLDDQVLILDSVYFEPSTKNIISIDLDHVKPKPRGYELPNHFTSIETERHKYNLAAFQNIPDNYSFLEHKFLFVALTDKYAHFNHQGYLLAGPVRTDYQRYVNSAGQNTRYKHRGGYSYDFEDNIVYRQNYGSLFLSSLAKQYFFPMESINDLVLTKQAFLDRQRKKPDTGTKWYARTIDVSDRNFRLKVLLPEDQESMGIANIFFEDCATNTIILPCWTNRSQSRSTFQKIPAGNQNIIVLYNDGSYLKMDSLLLGEYMHIMLDFNQSAIQPRDKRSSFWLLSTDHENSGCYPTHTPPAISRTQAYSFQSTTGNITGTIYDQENEPLVGATILVKGTTTGTIADINGHFALDITEENATLIITYIGFITEEIEVSQGSNVIVKMVADISELSEVVVIGYGVMKKSDVTGALASVSQVTLVAQDDNIETPDDIRENEQAEAEQKLYRELLSLNNIRSNFSDVGFWEPKLFTNKKGEAIFTITFPDDITRWDATVYAMNRRLQTGTARKSIQSYKPIMAELHTPRFLTRGDSAYCLGKVLNYTSDSSMAGVTQWKRDSTVDEKAVQFGAYHTEKIMTYAGTTDTITAEFSFHRNDGYFDGERRNIPVVEQGCIRADGNLNILLNNKPVTIKAAGNEVRTIEILDNQLDIYAGEVRYLLNYKYACNEQLASKLTGLINHKIYMDYLGKKFRYDKDVEKIISRLLKNQNEEFLWSWWNISNNTSYWMSAHILRSLKLAQDAGYKVNLNIKNIEQKATYRFDMLKSLSHNDVDLLHALAVWNVELNYQKYINLLDTLLINLEYYTYYNNGRYFAPYSYLKEKLTIQEIRLMKNLSYQRDSLIKYQKEGIMGEIFFSDDKHSHYWYNNNMSANVIAYRIIKKDSALHHLKVPMQLYFIGERRKASWNTYHSATAIRHILPDLIEAGFSKANNTEVKISGKVNSTISEFPFRIQLQPGEELLMVKERGLPLYYMDYIEERVTEAKTGVEGFSIQTYFTNDQEELEAGEPVDLIVDVAVTKGTSAEYVMIEVPVPGACSYLNKKQSFYGTETHREYYKEKTVIFCRRMSPGSHRFVIHLLPRFTGKYLINPAQVSLMYVPVVNANTDMKKVNVSENK